MSYVELLKKTDLEGYYQERKELAALRFAYSDVPATVGAVYGAAQRLHDVPPNNLLNYRAEFAPLDASVLQTHLDSLSLDNMRIMLMAPDRSGDQTEPLYDVSYRIDPFTDEQKAKWKGEQLADLRMPKPNPYVPKEVVLSDEKPAEKRTCSTDDPGWTHCHYFDTDFSIPKIESRVDLMFEEDANSKPVRKLWVKMVNTSLEKELYPQQLAGSTMSVQNITGGLRLRVQAYNERHNDMQAHLSSMVLSSIPTIDIFDRVKAEMIVDLQNKKMIRPYSQGLGAIGMVLDQHGLSDEELIRLYQELSYEELSQKIATLKKKAHVQVFTFGNLSSKEAGDFNTQLKERLTFEELLPKPKYKLFVNQESIDWVLSIDHNDSVWIKHLQSSQTTMREQARYLLFSHLIRAPFFTELRTKQQLGYIVSAGYSRRNHFPGIRFGIQSSNTHPDELEKRVEKFLGGTQEWIKTMSNPEFEEAKRGLIAQLLAKDSRFSERVGRLSQNMDLGILSFDRKKQLSAQIEKLNQREMEIFVQQAIYDAPGITVKSVGNAHQAENKPTGCTDYKCVRKKMTIFSVQ